MFLLDKVVFLSYVISAKGIEVDEEKVKAIKEWTTPKSVTEIKVFMVWPVFIGDYSKILVHELHHSVKLLKIPWVFKWGSEQDRAFKKRLCGALLLALPDFSKTFENECDASEIGIASILMQKKRPIAYFSESIGDLATLPLAERICHTYRR
jgi:hypothetical protein